MLDQNTDRMWYVIGAVIIGAAIILILNGTAPELFASVAGTFQEKTEEVTDLVDDIGYVGLVDLSVNRGDINADGTVDIKVSADSKEGIKSVQLTDSAVPVAREKMLTFDGVDDYLDMPYNFGPVEAFTIGAEMTNVESMNFLTNHRAGHGWRLVDVNGMKVNNEGNWSGEAVDDARWDKSTNMRYKDSTNYVVITWDGTTAKRYINGELVASDDMVGTFTLETIMIGARINSSTNEINGYAAGTISDFFVAKNNAFSASEVADVYNNGIQNNEAGLVIHYDFEEGSGETVLDKSGNGNHGTITGAQWTTAFNVSKNGDYVVEVEDHAGNVRTRVVSVSGL